MTNNLLIASETGSQSGGELGTFSATPTDMVELCQRIAFGDGTVLPDSCRTVAPGYTPPPP